MRVELRKLIAMVAAGAAVLLLGGMYVHFIAPAQARAAEASCRSLVRSTEPMRSETIRPLDMAPAFSGVVDSEGNPVSIEQFRGRVVLLNFWATWCDTCRAEKPSMEALAARLGGEEFVVVTLASDTSFGPLRERYPSGAPFKIFLDRPTEEGEIGPTGRSYGISAIPDSFLIDKQGRVRHYVVNKRDWTSSIAKTCVRSLMDE